MRCDGKITSWNDERGFGFITPSGGGRRVFVHIKSFSNKQRRPAGNEFVTYELAADSQGRPQGKDVAFVGECASATRSFRSGTFSLALSVLFLCFLSVSVLAGKLPFAIFALDIGASALAFLAYAHDKSAARNDRWRTQESTLHIFGLIGGWPGALAAQVLLHHKSKKQSFQIVFWVTVIANCSVLIWLLSPSGSSALGYLLGAT
jgi:uncharacterized membrane protein YsdA (DUF1294 family)/cold shock CspA family protein